MGVEQKYAGYTHIALQIDSIAKAKDFFSQQGIAITSSFGGDKMQAIFVRDPDANVIEFDAYL